MAYIYVITKLGIAVHHIIVYGPKQFSKTNMINGTKLYINIYCMLTYNVIYEMERYTSFSDSYCHGDIFLFAAQSS